MVPRVSVIMPTFNRAAYIRRSIDSVLSQTIEDIELIIVDDVSTDNTTEIVESVSDRRISLIRQEKNMGAPAARNRGISAAKGEIIAFQDSDDVWLPHKLQYQIECLARLPACGACFSSFIYVTSGGAQLKGLIGENETKDIRKMLCRTNVVSTQVLAARADVIRAIGGFDERMPRYQDWEMAIRLSGVTELCYISEPLAVVYDTRGNISSSIVNDAVARMRIYEKHPDLFAGQEKVLALHLARAGASYVRNSRFSEGLAAFRTAIMTSPTSIGVWGIVAKAAARRVLLGSDQAEASRGG